MAVTTIDGLVAALTAGETRNWMKSAFTSEGAGTFHSLWTVGGSPGAGVAPGNANGLIPLDSTAGSFPFTNAVGAANNYVGYIAASSATAGTLVVYDRLCHSSGLSGIVTTPTALTPPALTRYTGGEGVEVWAEIYTALGVTAATLNFQYTDQDGTTAQAGTIAYPTGTPAVGQMLPAVLASGDYGVRAITNYSFSVSTGTAGNFGFTLMKRLVTIPLQTANVAAVYDAFSSGLREVADDACLAFMVQCTATAQGTIGGELTIAKG